MHEFTYCIIIPHYNIPRLLGRLLRTIPKRDDLQVIVVDDCSTKDLEDLSKVKEEFGWAEWYSTEKNGGGGKARNIGLKHAKGKYILFADADDYFNLNFSNILDKYSIENYDLVYFAANSVDSETYQNSNRGNPITHGVSKYLETQDINNIRFKYTNPWCKLISHRLIIDNNIRFQESPVYNDMFFSQQVDFYAKTFNADSSAIYCITAREDSVSSINSPDKEIEKVKVMIQFFNFYKYNGIPYSPRYLIAPIYYDLKMMGATKHAKNSLKLWKEAGIKESEILLHLSRFKVRVILRKIKNLFFK